jgi:hypothetical protein
MHIKIKGEKIEEEFDGMYVFRGCASPFHSDVYASGHFANIVSRGTAPPEYVQRNRLFRLF